MTRSPTHLVCTYAATQFYTAGQVYEVTRGPKDEILVTGSDGIKDNPLKTLSKFKEVKPENMIQLVTK